MGHSRVYQWTWNRDARATRVGQFVVAVALVAGCLADAGTQTSTGVTAGGPASPPLEPLDRQTPSSNPTASAGASAGVTSTAQPTPGTRTDVAGAGSMQAPSLGMTGSGGSAGAATRAATAGAASLGAAGQSGAASTPPPPDAGAINPNDQVAPPNAMRGDALTEAYAALTRGERARAPVVVAAIDAQLAANPDGKYALFYAGAFRLWQLAETFDIATGPGVVDNLQRAHTALPDDFRVTGFYGLSQVLFSALGGAQAIEPGLKTLALAVEQHPTYNHFLRATALSFLSASDPAFATALSDMQGFAPDCGVTIDADGTYHYPTEPLAGRSRVCTNDGIVPHLWEGYFVSFGDIALKSGWDAKRAQAIYRSAQTAPTYEQWPYKRELERRIASAELNAAAYADGNPLNDPTVWALSGYICVGCHQK